MEYIRRNFVDFVERGAECGTEDEVNEILKDMWNTFNFIWLQCFETAVLNKIKYTSKTMEAWVYERVGVSHDDIMYLVRISTRLYKEDPELQHLLHAGAGVSGAA
jgi:enhancing lycopene biosynthesis protein 2